MGVHTLDNPAPAATAPSPLLVMHDRYEAAWEEYNLVDRAWTALSDRDEKERSLRCRYQDAMTASAAETDALRLAILYQVPSTWQEALVLQYHVHSAVDFQSSTNDVEKKAIEVALDTLFDFMCDEVDHDEKDGILRQSECLVSDRRHFRTGKLGS